MARNTLDIAGLEQLRAALRRLPAELQAEARGIVAERAEAAAAKVRANYEAIGDTGELADSVGTMPSKVVGAYGVGHLVYATAKQAHWLEFGTAARQTALGYGRGALKPIAPIHAFIPVLQRERRAMYDAFRDLLRRNGLEVSGDVD